MKKEHFGSGPWIAKVTWKNGDVEFHHFSSEETRNSFARKASSKRAVQKVSKSKKG